MIELTKKDLMVLDTALSCFINDRKNKKVDMYTSVQKKIFQMLEAMETRTKKSKDKKEKLTYEQELHIIEGHSYH